MSSMPAPNSRPPPQVPCPQCGTKTVYSPENKWRPFCSARCRGADLGAWASESYRMPTRPADDDETPDVPADEDVD